MPRFEVIAQAEYNCWSSLMIYGRSKPLIVWKALAYNVMNLLWYMGLRVKAGNRSEQSRRSQSHCINQLVISVQSRSSFSSTAYHAYMINWNLMAYFRSCKIQIQIQRMSCLYDELKFGFLLSLSHDSVPLYAMPVCSIEVQVLILIGSLTLDTAWSLQQR